MTRRPNVLMIVADNQSADSLGCYGNSEHETPNIDRLAREGTRFELAFCTNGLCSPSRASILTGLMPSQHGVHMAIPDDDVVPKAADYDTTREFRSLPQTLRDAGYRTGMVGKWHLGNHRCPGNGFDHWVAFTKGHTTNFYDNQVFRNGREERIEGVHIVDWFTDRAIEYVEAQSADQPWFLQVNYDGPYVLPPTVVGADERNPFYDQFRNKTFQSFPPVVDGIIKSLFLPFDFDLDPEVEYTLESAVNNTWWTVRVHNDQATRANIAAQNALLDACVGRLIGALDASGMAEDTLVLYTTDQGNPYGQHGLWGHPVWTDPPYMHDVTFQVPLIARQPGTVAAMRTSDRIVSHVDLLPTVLEHVRLDSTQVANSPGRSFEPILRGDGAPEWVDEAYYEQETARSVRTHRYRFTKQLDGFGDDELIDLVRDPDQSVNVADDPVYAAVVAELTAKVQQFWGEHADERYDLWNGGSAQAMVSRYMRFKERYGRNWDVTTEVGPAFRD